MTLRRTFIQQISALTALGTSAWAQAQSTLAAALLPGSTAAGSPTKKSAKVTLLSGAKHPKFINPLPNPLDPVNCYLPTGTVGTMPGYTLRLREFSTRIGLVDPNGTALATTLWGYVTSRQPVPTSPGRTFVAQAGTPISVSYVNELVAGGLPLPHRLPLDTTLMWANPGNLGGTAPVPLVAHRHGGAQNTLDDGLPDGWSTPDANADGLPDFRGSLHSGAYTYANDQEAAHIWYHDHALGVTRQNVYMGLAGHFFIRDGNEAYLTAKGMLPGAPYEIALVIQDRMYTATGDLHYPSSSSSSTAPAVTHLPEFFGDFILVNGVPWPQCAVEPRPYRLRLLNGSDSRFYLLSFTPTGGAPVTFHQVGTDLGLMNAPVPLTRLVLAPGERADLVVDFSALASRKVMVTNTAATPFPAGKAVDPATAGQLMVFNVTRSLDATVPKAVLPAYLRPNLDRLADTPVTAGVPVRKLLLLEGTDAHGRLQTMLGTVNPAPGNPVSPAHGTFFYSDPTTENIAVGTTEVWELHNTTVDAHPVHLHLVDFRVVNRQPFTGTVVPKPMGPSGGTTGGYLTRVALAGPARPAEPNEAGRKDTVTAYPGEITRILVHFPRAGEYVWHCHILSHEDHEMMRRFVVS